MGKLNLPTSGQAYIDANIAIYSVEKIEPYRSLLFPFWQAAQHQQFQVISSDLTILETFVKPFKECDAVLEATFRELLTASKEVRLVPITRAILEKAALLRATIGLKPPDAIHAATALIEECAVFITNDMAFERVAGLNVKIKKKIL